MHTRRQVLAGLAGSAGLAAFPRVLKSSRNTKPNIVLFLVDDLGWGDLGCYGDTFHQTPNINRLAVEGMKFTSGYAAAPVCSPSRAAIQTGKSPARLHLTQWIPDQASDLDDANQKLIEPPTPQHLDLSVPTIAELLKRVGYHTAAIGKWHLGGNGYLPEKFGFDVNVAGDHHGEPALPNHYFGPFHYHNLTGYTKSDYLTEVLTNKMDQFLEQAVHHQPFFLYMAEYSVHIPLQARQPLIEKYHRQNGNRDEPDPVYAAMVESVDTALGNLRATLARLGVADNTVIYLTSDNGGNHGGIALRGVGFDDPDPHRVADNGFLRAGKGFLYEGGVREPFIVYWPGVTKPGSVCDVPVAGTDIMPTIMSMIDEGPAPEPCDGIDISGLFHGKTSLERDALYWHYPNYSPQGGTPSGAIRQGDWKLLEFFEGGNVELYNLASDPGEQHNCASRYSDRAMTMQRRLQAWRRSVNAAMPTPNPRFNSTRAGLSADLPDVDD
jgi:arylsulfatase A